MLKTWSVRQTNKTIYFVLESVKGIHGTAVQRHADPEGIVWELEASVAGEDA